MEVRKGYKQADIGILPNDWNATIIDELVEKVGSGITPTGGEKVYTKEGHPFLRSQNVGWGELLLNDVAYISDETHKTFPATEICSGDVFLNITGASIGRSALASSSIVGGNVNQHVCIIRPNETKLRSAFLCFSLLSSIGQNQIESFQAGGNRQGLNFAQIRSIKIPLPPTLAEQTAIAIALSDTDALIQNLEKLIAKKRAIKKGAMQELLTGKKRLPGFSGKWDEKKLEECLKVKHGKSQHAIVDPNGEFPILATSGVVGKSNQYLYNKPSVLIGRKGTIDSPQYMDTPFWTIDTLFYTEIFKNSDAKFLFYRFINSAIKYT
jgi:type I restriction enzyme S subunit